MVITRETGLESDAELRAVLAAPLELLLATP
jgi:hypothetical protein